MTEFYQFIGAILRDISQARVTSDVYSREVSLFYGRDALLRYFPVPRTEISSLELDLKFAVRQVVNKTVQSASVDVLLSGLVEKSSEVMARSVMTRFVKSAEAHRKVNPENPSWQDFKAQYVGDESLRVIQQTLSETFRRNTNKWVVYDDEGKIIFHTKEAQTEIQRVIVGTDFFRRLSELFRTLPITNEESSDDEITNENQDARAFEERRKWFQRKTRDVFDHILVELRKLGQQLSALESAQEDVEIDVLVTADELQDIPPSSISSVKLNTVIRNSVWTQMSEDDANNEKPPVQRLIPE